MVMTIAGHPIENGKRLSAHVAKRARLSAYVYAYLAASIAAMPLALAHPGDQSHAHILHKPNAGISNNDRYDYRSDVEEAKNKLRKDLRRAKTSQVRWEAWAEYNSELLDARHDYATEMAEKGHIRPPRVTVSN
jgi:hypothetical protein